MTYGDRIVIQDGQASRIPVTDEWVLANKPRTLLLTAAKATAAIDEDVTVSVQLRTPVLTDGTYNEVNQAGDVLVSVSFDDGETVAQLVTLDANGAGALVVSALVAGTIRVEARSLLSNAVEIEVT